MNAPATKAAAAHALMQIANIINKMTGIADDKLSQIAGEESDAAARDALLIAVDAIDDKMETLRALLTRGYSIASPE